MLFILQFDDSNNCKLEHCGNSICKKSNKGPDGSCRVESSALPFQIRVDFGKYNNDTKTSTDGNTGMCLNYEQLPCSA